MNRRSILKGLGLTTGLALTGKAFEIGSWAQQTAPLPGSSSIRTIETPTATLRLSERTGDLVGLRWKNPDLEVISEPRLGESFRVLLPKNGFEADYFYSRDQSVSSIQATNDGALCTYDSLRNRTRRRYRSKCVIGSALRISRCCFLSMWTTRPTESWLR